MYLLYHFRYSMETPLSKEEAIYFVKVILAIDEPELKLSQDKIKFLNELVQSYIERVPFQNLHLLAQAHQHQCHIPTWTEIKAAMMSGHGGLCFTLNVFMKVLLEIFGYSAYCAACDIESPSDHITTIVQNLSHEGSQHLVDLNGFPNFEAIPLDFGDTSPMYKFSFCTHYFKKVEDKVLRYNVTEGKVQLFETIYLKPRELPHFFESMSRIYTNSKFLEVLHVVTFYRKKCVAVKGTRLLTEDEHCLLQKTNLDCEKAKKVLNEHLPQISSDIISAAVAHCHLNKSNN